MSKKISVSLSTRDIGRAIRELEAYQRSLEEKANILAKRIADRLQNDAQNVFNSAIVDDLTGKSGGAISANVKVTVEQNGQILVVIAQGEDAIWVEFGTGVYHNGSEGSSPHPKGVELGYRIGRYGMRKGRRNSWGFRKDGELKITRGAPARMPMYGAMMRVIADVGSIAEEVFSR